MAGTVARLALTRFATVTPWSLRVGCCPSLAIDPDTVGFGFFKKIVKAFGREALGRPQPPRRTGPLSTAIFGWRPRHPISKKALKPRVVLSLSAFTADHQNSKPRCARQWGLRACGPSAWLKRRDVLSCHHLRGAGL